MRKKREANFELLRIVSMLFIIGGHFFQFTGVLNSTEMFCVDYYVVWLLEAVFYTGTNCFLLLSGFFYDHTHFTSKKLLSLYGMMFFYSFGIAIVLHFTGLRTYSAKELLYAATPFSTRQYWFMTSYIGLCIISPILNITLDKMEKNHINKLLLVLFGVLSLLPTIWIGEGLDGGKGYSVLWFTYLYLIGGYIKKYGVRLRIESVSSKILWGGVFVICTLLIMLSKALIDGVATDFGITTTYSLLFYYNNTPLMLLASISLFLLFRDFKIEKHEIECVIMWLSGSTLGVYLIHMHMGLAKVYWSKLAEIINIQDVTLYLGLVWIPAAVFLLCTVVEKGRRFVIQLIVNNIKGRGK